MIETNNKLTVKELSKGMQVKSSQLSDIYNVHIILTDVKKLPNGDSVGTIGFIGEELNNEASTLFVPGACICSLYKEKDYYDCDVMYDD